MSNSNHLAGRELISSYGSADISGNSRVHQGNNNANSNTTVYTDKFVQQISLFGEIPTQGTLDAFLRSKAQLTLNTNQPYNREQSRGRNYNRGGGNDIRRGRHHDTPCKHASHRSRSPSASTSPSKTRIPGPRFSSRSRRYSSLSRDSWRSDISSPASAIVSSATSSCSFQEHGEVFAPRNDVLPPLPNNSQPCLNKPLPWGGHLLDPRNVNNTLSRDTPESSSGDQPVLATDKTIPPERRHGAGQSLEKVWHHLQLALAELEQVHVDQKMEENHTSHDCIKTGNKPNG
ncbi:hypothetical protein H2198_001362 [Neophaeococcomyces mojaviensis]|uniref:Uncharacterized protein n=1 Tax=Neophaeococcomyces mojaviensis TaxID=3383035 RepID=A0ACC3AHY9_9EURO|nr:hypothetical protein H2198_001362 [Knufia sp. JES_112]